MTPVIARGLSSLMMPPHRERHRTNRAELKGCPRYLVGH
jgi:hypothetical protein